MSKKLLLHGRGVQRTASVGRQPLTKDVVTGNRQTITISFTGLSSSHRYITQIPGVDQQINAQPARLEITGKWTFDGNRHVNTRQPEIILHMQGGGKSTPLQIIKAQIILERRGVTVYLTW